MKALDDIANAIPEEMLAKAKYEEPKDAKEVAYDAILAEQKVGTNFMQSLQQDAKNSGAEKVPPAPKDIQDDESEKNTTKNDDEKQLNKKRVDKLATAFENVQKKKGGK